MAIVHEARTQRSGYGEDASTPSTLLQAALQREYRILTIREQRLHELQDEIDRRRRQIAALEALVDGRDHR